MKYAIALILITTVISGCITAPSSDLKYENVLIPMPLPEDGWVTFGEKRNGKTNTGWQKDKEILELTIFHDKNAPSPSGWRKVTDQALDEKIGWQSTVKTIKTGQKNNYPFECWETQVVTDTGKQVYNLQIYIKGNDAAYLLSKRSFDLADEAQKERKMWIEYFMTVEVYDTRYPEHQGTTKLNPQPVN